VIINKKVWESLLFTLFAFVFSFYSQPSKANSIQLVSHDLQCDLVFTCPPELQRRIDFWIQVFRHWSLDDRVFHDANKPERVYSVVRTEDKCRRKRPKGQVKAEYVRIKSSLNSIADALKKGASPESLRSRPYANLFDTLDEKTLREAAESVRCQSGNKERFEKALSEFERYQPFILATLRQNGLPDDIQYLPFVESAFNPRAYSHVGAAGLWQIMPKTGRSLGLQVGSAVDERLEPNLATMAAAKYFVDSIGKLTRVAVATGASIDQHDLNPFVITSYNYGVRGMERAIEQVGTDYMRLLAEYKSNSFRTAVRNFYASFLAARYVAQQRQFYFPNVTAAANPATTLVRLKKAAMLKQLTQAFGVDKDTLKDLNPSLTYRVWKGTLPVPRGYDLHLPQRAQGWAKQTSKLSKMREPRGMDSGKRHKVRRGQTACGIANRHGVSCNKLLALNKLNRKSTIKIGQRLKIPGNSKKSYIVSDTYQRGRKLIQQQVRPASNTYNALPTNSAYEKAYDDAKERAKEKAALALSSPTTTTIKSNNKSAPKPSLAFDTSVKRKSNYAYVRVLAGETLGHYSDWMGGGLSKIRRSNGYSSSNRRIGFGERVKIPFANTRQKIQFERERKAFHQRISQSYFQNYRVTKTVKQTVRDGQTLWGIASKAGIPMWLLHHYNPRLKTAQRGAKLRIPKVKRI